MQSITSHISRKKQEKSIRLTCERVGDWDGAVPLYDMLTTMMLRCRPI